MFSMSLLIPKDATLAVLRKSNIFLGRELTDPMILSLSQQITNESDLRNLAIRGLDMKVNIVDKHVNSRKPEMTLAAEDIITKWRNNVVNSRTAYRRLCDARERVGMIRYIHEVLERSSG